jgi:branched-chain amino acid aminotransferase
VIHPARRPFPEGSGIFETLRTEGGRVAELGRHMRRAVKASQALGIAMPDEDSLRVGISAALQSEPHPLGRLRICISEKGQLAITHDPYQEIEEFGYLTFSPHTTKAEGEQFKRYPYVEHYEIVDEARAHGFDDAMIFNSANNVTETGLSNLAFLFGDEWVTPPISAGILPGTMRAIAIERMEVSVRNIHITEIPNASEIVVLGSLKIAQPITQVGEMRLACGPAAQLFAEQMRQKVEYFSVV